MQQAELIDSKEKLKELEEAASEGLPAPSLIWLCVMSKVSG